MSRTPVSKDASQVSALADAMRAVDPAVAERVKVVTSWPDTEFVFRSKAFEPPSRHDGFGNDYQALFMGDSLVDIRGDLHFERRRLESTLFRADTLLAYEQELALPQLRETLDRVSSAPGEDGWCRADLHAFILRTFLSITGRLIGLDGIDDPVHAERFVAQFHALDAAAFVKYTTVDPEEVVRRGLEAQKIVAEELFWPSWRRREALVRDAESGRGAADELPNDLITLMLQHPEHFSKFDEDVYIHEASLYMVASVGTTAQNVCHVVNDIERWVEQHPEDADRRTDSEWLQLAIHESLRLHSSRWRVRAALEDVTLPSGLEVSRGEIVWMDHRVANVELFGPDANEFDLHRTLAAQRPPYGLAFADGRHTCIGKLMVLGDGGTGPDARRGLAKSTLLECYRAGMRLDPAHPPEPDHTTVRDRWLTFPVRFAQAGRA